MAVYRGRPVSNEPAPARRGLAGGWTVQLVGIQKLVNSFGHLAGRGWAGDGLMPASWAQPASYFIWGLHDAEDTKSSASWFHIRGGDDASNGIRLKINPVQ